MEKLIAISDLFEISLDELVLGRTQECGREVSDSSGFMSTLEEKVCTPDNKRKAKTALKVIAIIAGILIAVDVISMIIYFCVNGIPK